MNRSRGPIMPMGAVANPFKCRIHIVLRLRNVSSFWSCLVYELHASYGWQLKKRISRNIIMSSSNHISPSPEDASLQQDWTKSKNDDQNLDIDKVDSAPPKYSTAGDAESLRLEKKVTITDPVFGEIEEGGPNYRNVCIPHDHFPQLLSHCSPTPSIMPGSMMFADDTFRGRWDGSARLFL